MYLEKADCTVVDVRHEPAGLVYPDDFDNWRSISGGKATHVLTFVI